MSAQYDLYLQQHRSNVHKGFEWIQENLPELVKDGVGWQTEFAHDASKNEPDEYEAYDRYFYGNNKSYQVMQDYRKAWLLHIHRNPHHWQHWVLINDDPKEGEIVLDMPYNYILEMICDWWAFSWSKGKLFEIFDWYDEHKDYIKMSPQTRKTVDDILGKMKKKLSENALLEEISMFKRELLKNKLYGAAMIGLGALSVPIEWDGTFFLFTLMAGCGLIFAKENWII